MVAVEIKIKVAKKWLSDVEAMRRLAVPLAVGHVIANRIYRRVFVKGNTLTPWKKWTPLVEWKSAIHVEQADQLGIPKSRRIKAWYSQQEGGLMVLCRFTRKNPTGHGGNYQNTGGLARGLQVSARGGAGVKINFGGSSLNAQGTSIRNDRKALLCLQPLDEGYAKTREYPTRTAKGNYRSPLAPRKNRVNLLRLSTGEEDAIFTGLADATTTIALRIVGSSFDLTERQRFGGGGDAALASEIRAAAERAAF